LWRSALSAAAFAERAKKMSDKENAAPAGLSLREQERERSACREWLNANGGDKMNAAEREAAEKAWLCRAEQQKKKPFLSPSDKENIITPETAEKLAWRLSSRLGMNVDKEDPILISALSGVVLYEELQNRQMMLLERLVERMERYETELQDAARLLQYNAAFNADMKKGLDDSLKKIDGFNVNAAKLADKHGQILRVDSSDSRALYLIGFFGVVICALLAVLAFK